MTTGSTLTGAFQDVVVPVFGVARVGTWRTRVWSGGDLPSGAPRKRKKVYRRVEYTVPVPVPSRKAQYVYRHGRSGRVKIVGYALSSPWSLVKKIPAVPALFVQKKRHKLVKLAPWELPAPVSLEEHPYSATITSRRESMGSYYSALNGRGYDCTKSQILGSFGEEFPSDLWQSVDEYALISKLRSEVVGSDFNLAVFLAEAPQALGMIADAAGRLYRAYGILTRGTFVGDLAVTKKRALNAWRVLAGGTRPPWEFSNRAPALKDAASAFLLMQYGVRPLLSDIKEGTEQLAHVLYKPLRKKYVVTRTKYGIPPPAVNPYMQYVGRVQVIHRRLSVEVRDVSMVALTGLSDVSSAVWNRIPWSFVVDWVLPVSSYLNARGISSSLTGVFTSTTTERRTHAGVFYAPPGGDVYDVPSQFSRVTVERVVTETLPVPLPWVKTFGESASWERAANAVALLTQQLPNRLFSDRRFDW